MPELDQVTVGIEEVHRRSAAPGTSLFAWSLHVADVVEGVPVGKARRPDALEGGLELLGSEREGEVMTTFGPPGRQLQRVRDRP